MDHGVADEPVMRRGMHIGQRVRPVAHVQPVQCRGDLAGHFQRRIGHLLGHRRVQPFQEGIGTLCLLALPVETGEGNDALGHGSTNGRFNRTWHG